ncbi:MAG: DUF3667 domain-containing protein [Saprospiraceae bacterium]
MKLNIENTTCRNCQTAMPEQSLYCPKCSQKNTDGRIPILSFVKDLLENLFSLDSKLLKTSLGLFIPGKLTNEFFKGKHRSFATPSRLFLASAILFFAMVSVVVQVEIKDEEFKGGPFGNTKGKNKELLKVQLTQLKTLKEKFGVDLDEKMQGIYDSLELQIKKNMVDTNTTNITLWNKPYKFLISDIEHLPADSIIQKYNIESLIDRMVFKQAHKLNKNPKSLIFKLISNLTWMMLLLIPSMALIFKLLYFRRKKYYVEHLVFLFHTHAFIFLVGAIILGIILLDIGLTLENVMTLLSVILILYFIIALRNVYEQSWWKTILKTLFISVSYFFVFLICTSLILMVSFILF